LTLGCGNIVVHKWVKTPCPADYFVATVRNNFVALALV
jgi:hypothetical protein